LDRLAAAIWLFAVISDVLLDNAESRSCDWLHT
jgi:hypothetical protein